MSTRKRLLISALMCFLMFTPGILFTVILPSPWSLLGPTVIFWGGMAYQHYLTEAVFGTLQQTIKTVSPHWTDSHITQIFTGWDETGANTVKSSADRNEVVSALENYSTALDRENELQSKSN